ncbi:GNAT family N-acetyltransferase [Cohnella panacarvi]|uniref:GNAT family N-acetyltransferase n=1 Tax=Cohnella panacarvi TaxID=400776 RepID=UPI0024810D08|nr:GNAT family N-acetyltransferase [Cohnella panacarvi]
MLSEWCQDPHHLLLGAAMFDQPAGLLIAIYSADKSIVVINSIFVAPRFRNMGIATRLLKAVIEHSKGSRIDIKYFTNLSEVSYLERALHQVGFDPPELASVYYQVDLSTLAAAPWISRCKRSPGYRMVPWQQITEQQRQDLKEKRYCDYPETLSPFIQEEVIEASGSFVLLRGDGVIMGWIIYHRHVKHAVLSRSLFIAESLQNNGIGLTMIGYSVSRMADRNIQCIVFQVIASNRRMLRLVDRMILPYRGEQTEFRLARLTSKQPQG